MYEPLSILAAPAGALKSQGLVAALLTDHTFLNVPSFFFYGETETKSLPLVLEQKRARGTLGSETQTGLWV